MSEFEKALKKATATQNEAPREDTAQAAPPQSTPPQTETSQSTTPQSDKSKYREMMQARKAELKALATGAYSSIATDRKAFVGMLDVAAHFIRNSPNNIVLIYAQRPGATNLRSYNGWKQNEKVVKKGIKPVYVYTHKYYTDSKGNRRDAYDPEARYDILDTVDGAVAPPPKFDEKILVRGLIHACAAKVVVDADFQTNDPVGAAYIKDKHEIRCQYGMPLDEIVPTLINAAALSYFCKDTEVSRPDDYAFKARCIAYLLTKKYGIMTNHISIDSIPASYADMDADDFKKEIEELLKTAKNIDEKVGEILFRPRTQEKAQADKASEVPSKSSDGKEVR